jgi:2-polyprenyl-3-methyl-5-hydroxy-6-metoxy-1,4-benzoquinol methylase
MMEITVCDLCKSDKSSPVISQPDRFSGKIFAFVKCSNCGLVYLNPRPSQTQLSAYYPQEYEAFDLTTNEGRLSTQGDIEKISNMQLALVQKFISTRGRILDIGCATGNFINNAKDKGWEVTGIEFVEQAAETARQRYGLDVKHGSIETVNLQQGYFDVITLWDVLEHLPSPTTALDKCYQLLRPGGIVAFSIPNLDSFDRFLFKQSWIGWDVPRHLHLFSRTTLEHLLKAAGFDLIDRRCIFGGKGTFLLSLKNRWCEPKQVKVINALYPFISVVLWPYRQISYLLAKGPIVHYVARKIESQNNE